jgi:hypothetical protein
MTAKRHASYMAKQLHFPCIQFPTQLLNGRKAVFDRNPEIKWTVQCLKLSNNIQKLVMQPYKVI